MAPRPIVFATDFGPGTEWVGVCRAVIESIAPQAVVIDLVHSLPKFDPGAAGMILREAMPYAPVCFGALVVDPDVGTERRALVARTGRGDVLVGPDNGLLLLAAEKIGGVDAVRILTASDIRLRSASATFHGRDVFCPAAAHLFAGFPFESVGPEVELASLARAPLPLLHISPGRLACEVTDVDSFGNIRLSARPELLVEAGLDHESMMRVLAPSGEFAVHRAPTFGAIEEGRTGLIVDSFGWLCLCINRGDAAQKLGAERGSRIELCATT